VKDSGSIVVGWLTKVVLILSLLGLAAFDGIAMVSASFTADDHANTIARLAADSYRTSRNPQEACAAAHNEALINGETLNCADPKAFQVYQDGRVTLVIHRKASTLWLHRISFLEEYTDLTSNGVGRPGLS
jgi:hypothetical protein